MLPLLGEALEEAVSMNASDKSQFRGASATLSALKAQYNHLDEFKDLFGTSFIDREAGRGGWTNGRY